MAIKNPYGVGDSGALAREVRVKCQCCCLPFIVVMGLRTPLVTRVCSSCKHHNLAGSTEDRLTALEDHAERSREFAERAYTQLRAGLAERDEALGERKRLGRALFEANQDRDYLRSQLRAAWNLHVETPRGECSCGETSCLTREEANRVADDFDYHRVRWLDVPRRL